MNAKWLVAMAMAAGPMLAYGQPRVATNDGYRTAISADVKGFGRDGAWSGGAWQPLRGDQHSDQHSATPSVVPVAAPELGLGFAASGLALCIGGVAVARGRRAG